MMPIKDFTADDIDDPVLKALYQVENSGKLGGGVGASLTGKEGGDRAGGPWQMIPSTFAGIVKGNKNLHADPTMGPLADSYTPGGDNSGITNFLSTNTVGAYRTARQLRKQHEAMAPGDLNRQIYLWNQGSLNGADGKPLSDDQILSGENRPHPKEPADYVQSVLKKMPGGQLNQNAISPLSVGSNTPASTPAVNKADDGEYSDLLARYPGEEAKATIVQGHDMGLSARSTESQMLHNAVHAHRAGKQADVEQALGIPADSYLSAARRMDQVKEETKNPSQQDPWYVKAAGMLPDANKLVPAAQKASDTISPLLDAAKTSLDYNPMLHPISAPMHAADSLIQRITGQQGQYSKASDTAKSLSQQYMDSSNAPFSAQRMYPDNPALRGFYKSSLGTAGIPSEMTPEEGKAYQDKYATGKQYPFVGDPNLYVNRQLQALGPMFGAGALEHAGNPGPDLSGMKFDPNSLGGEGFSGGNGADSGPIPPPYVDPETAAAQKAAQWRSPLDLANGRDVPNWNPPEASSGISPQDHAQIMQRLVNEGKVAGNMPREFTSDAPVDPYGSNSPVASSRPYAPDAIPQDENPYGSNAPVPSGKPYPVEDGGNSVRPEDDYPSKYPSGKKYKLDETAGEPTETSPAADVAPKPGIVERIKKTQEKAPEAAAKVSNLTPEISAQDYHDKLDSVNHEAHLSNLERIYGPQIAKMSADDQAGIASHTMDVRDNLAKPKSVGAAAADFKPEGDTEELYRQAREGEDTPTSKPGMQDYSTLDKKMAADKKYSGTATILDRLRNKFVDAQSEARNLDALSKERPDLARQVKQAPDYPFSLRRMLSEEGATNLPGKDVPENQSLSKFEDVDPLWKEEATKFPPNEQYKPQAADYVRPKSQTREVLPGDELSRADKLQSKFREGRRTNPKAVAAFQERVGEEIPGYAMQDQHIGAPDVSQMHMPFDATGPAEGITPENRFGQRIDPRLAEQRLQQELKAVPSSTEGNGYGIAHTPEYMNNARKENLLNAKETLSPKDVIKKSENDSGTLYANGGPKLLDAIKKANFSKMFPDRLNKILNTGEVNKVKDVLTNNFRGALSGIADDIKAMDQQYRAQGMGAVDRLKALQSEFLKMHKNALTKLQNAFVEAGMPREEASAWANTQKDFAASTDATTGLLRKWINLKKVGNITTSPAAFLGEFGAEVYSHAMGGYSPLKLPEAQFRMSKWMGGGSDAALEYGQKAGLLQGEMHNVTSYDPTLTKNLREIRREGGGVKSAWGAVINGMGHAKDFGFNAYDHMLDVSRTNAYLQEIPKNFDSLSAEAKTKAAQDAVFTVDKFFQNYNRSAGGRIGKALGLESTAAKILTNPSLKFPLEMARITKNAAVERPAFALGTMASMLALQQWGVHKAKANGIKLTPAQETSFIAPFGKKAIEYNYHIPFLGLFAGYNKDPGKGALENGMAAVGHAASDLMNNGALKGITDDLKPGQLGLKDALKLFASVPSMHSANLVMQTPAAKSLNPMPNIVQRLSALGRVRNGEKTGDTGEDLLNAVGAKTIDRVQSINTPNARAKYIEHLNNETTKEISDLNNPYKNKQYTAAEIASRKRDLMEEMAQRTRSLNK